jgi:DNA-binding response OmpR family regulator
MNIDITKNARFEVFLSMDEENILSRIRINDLVLNLGERVYNHLLLLLVREKKVDIEAGLNRKLSGWVHMESISNALSKELLKDVDNYYINIQIHRLRKHLMSLEPYGYLFTNIIEREKGKLRFNMDNFKIIKGKDLVAEPLNIQNS